MNTKDLLQKTGMLAVLTLALASCSEDELINRKGAAGNAISFGIASPTHSADSLPSRSPQAEEPPLLLLGEGKRDTLYLHTSITDNIATPPDQEPATRGIPVDETNFKKVYGSFGITAYAEGGALFMDEEISHESGGIWSPDETRYWPADKDLTLDFYAQAPYGNAHVTDVKAGEGKISFSYTVPGGTGNTDAEAQRDILFAYAACSKAASKGGTVSLEFGHALAGVKFVASDVTGSKIKNITLKGLKGEGTCTYTYDAGTGKFDWQTSGGERDFSQTFNVELSGQQTGEQPITDKRPETTFMMIPQTLEGVTVEVTLVETASGKSFTLTGSLAQTGTWEAGKIYTYAISTESINWVYEFEVTPTITFPLGETQAQYTVTSYRYRKGNPEAKEPVAWSAENTSSSEKNLENNTSTNVPLNEILSEFTCEDDAPATISTGYDIELTETTLHTTYEGDQTLKDATKKGSPENPYDLSTEGGTISQTTANCYVVNAAGTYQLPLVYGNAIKNGSENSAAYQGGKFKDYQNNTINNSRITNADNAVLVWSDGFFMFKDIHLDAGKQNLVFTIDSNYMQQANAVLAVRDASNQIMWSWHIWVTERLVYTKRHILQDYFDDSNTYVLMQCNLGWVDGKWVYYNQRDLTFRFTQVGSDKTDELIVRQEGAKFDYKDVGSTYYQWGRKDPLVALKNWNSYGYEEYRLHETGDPDYVYRVETGSTTIGNAIQHPNVFYTRTPGATDGNDWNGDHTTTLWNAGDNGGTLESTTSVKTIYDPSPRGFKVPIPRAFAIWVNGFTGDGTDGTGVLNGYVFGDNVHNKYRVYPRANQYEEEEIPLTATGQRADVVGLPVYEEDGPIESEIGGLWSLYGVYYWTCVPKNTTSAYTLVIRKDHPRGLEVYSYGFVGTKTMARPVRPIADR